MVYRRRRRLVLLAGIGLVLATWLGARAVLGSPGGGLGGTGRIAAHSWTVRPGDTIWSIAQTLDPSGDVRSLVDQLSAEVHGQPLQVGQQLPVP